MKETTTGNTKRKRAWDKSGGNCWYCGCKLDPNDWHLDHIAPRASVYRGSHSRRYINSDKNLAASCPLCNRLKSDLSVEQFRVKIQSVCVDLMSNSGKFALGARYNQLQIQLCPNPVMFWFEKQRPK